MGGHTDAGSGGYGGQGPPPDPGQPGAGGGKPKKVIYEVVV